MEWAGIEKLRLECRQATVIACAQEVYPFGVKRPEVFHESLFDRSL